MIDPGRQRLVVRTHCTNVSWNKQRRPAGKRLSGNYICVQVVAEIGTMLLLGSSCTSAGRQMYQVRQISSLRFLQIKLLSMFSPIFCNTSSNVLKRISSSIMTAEVHCGSESKKVWSSSSRTLTVGMESNKRRCVLRPS
jgi:hypothetical protein